MKVSLCIPTYNAGPLWTEWIVAYKKQSLEAHQVIVIDSSSTDDTAVLARQAGFIVHSIPQAEFNHGGTRNLGAKFASTDTDILVFLTQDALLANEHSLDNLVQVFNNPEVAAAYGRQLPHQNASSAAAHARLFNYPVNSSIKDKKDIPQLGIKTAFISNSFAAYRQTVFTQLNGFPNDTILAEDMYLSAQIILAGYKVAYCAEACVYHSHNYSLKEEFQRYFDTGVFQQQQSWIQEQFGKADGEGKKFVMSEFRFLIKHNPLALPRACISTLLKLLGFKLGLRWNKLPMSIVKKLSMHKSYWK